MLQMSRKQNQKADDEQQKEEREDEIKNEEQKDGRKKGYHFGDLFLNKAIGTVTRNKDYKVGLSPPLSFFFPSSYVLFV